MSERRSIARDLAATGCGCDEDIAPNCAHMQDGCCTYTAFGIEKALDAAHAAGREAGMREAAGIAYSAPHYVGGMGLDEFGVMPPGSPYDKGRHDAMKAILSAIRKPKT